MITATNTSESHKKLAKGLKKTEKPVKATSDVGKEDMQMVRRHRRKVPSGGYTYVRQHRRRRKRRWSFW